MSLLITLYFLPKSSAFPLITTRNNISIDADRAWVPAPDGRGTYDLIMGCLATLSLCIWISHHPNIHPKSGAFKTVLKGIRWIVIASLAPEYVLYCAWDQRRAATRLLKQVNALGAKAFEGHGSQEFPHPSFKTNYDSVVDLRLLDTRSTHNPPPRFDDEEHSPSVYSRRDSMALSERFGEALSSASVSPTPTVHGSESLQSFEGWSIQQAFFAVSGGFIVESSTWWHESHLTFTPGGVLELAKAGLLPKISQAKLREKSRSDILGIMVVCVQTGWFLVHSVARLARNEPLTLLEIHVMAHVVCAFFTYLLWAQKPCHRGAAVVCTDKDTTGIAALFAVDAEAEERHYGTERFEYDRLLRPVDIKEVRSAHSGAQPALPIWQRPPLKIVGQQKRQLDKIDDFADPTFMSTDSTSTPQTMDTHLSLANHGLSYLRAKSTAKHDLLNPDERLSHVLAQLEQEPTFRYNAPNVATSIDDFPIVGSSTNLDVADNDGSKPRGRKRGQIYQSGIYAFLGTLYGGAHLAVWPMHFPSVVEMWLWRGAGIAMTGLPVVGLFYIVVANVLDKVFTSRAGNPAESMQQHKTADWTAASRKAILGSIRDLVTIVAVALMLAYVLARVLVLAEVFASLRSPQVGTYDDVAWTGYIPHIG